MAHLLQSSMILPHGIAAQMSVGISGDISGGAPVVQREARGAVGGLEDPAGTGFLTVLNPTYFNWRVWVSHG
jgi:hypothetical protein